MSGSRRPPNPYNWQHHDPSVEVPRSLTELLAEELLQGGAAVVIGGRGMGKSVLLGQVGEKLAEREGVRVIRFPSPPQSLLASECLEVLAERLGEATASRTSFDVLMSYFERQPEEHLVLLYDEFDRYAQAPAPGSPVAGQLFFNDLESARRAVTRLGILAVGTLGTFVFRDVLGSSFLSRAARFWTAPFTREETRRLARPFSDRGQPLSDEVLETLHLSSGGIPALLTYGLQRLWPLESVFERDVAAAYTHFQERYGEFLSDVTKAFSEPALSRIPLEVWQRIRTERGPFARQELEATCGSPGGALQLSVADVLNLLQAAGLIRIDGSATSDDPIEVHPVAGFLGLPEVSPPADGFAARFQRDLGMLTDRLHASSADFFRPGREAGEKQLVPESVFSAFLALGFGLLGWQAEREAQQGAGRTDLKLRRNGSPELALVEVKIWGRAGYLDAHRQLEGYWTRDVVAGAVVMVSDAEISDWTAIYRERCLASNEAEPELVETGDAALRARFRSRPPSRPIDHLLLRLPRSAATARVSEAGLSGRGA